MLSFNRNITSNSCDAFVREVAEQCAAATLSRLSTDAARMTPPELRGYARSHAVPCICAEVGRMVSEGLLAEGQRNDLTARALEQTVHLVTRAYLLAPIISLPVPHIGLRTAA